MAYLCMRVETWQHSLSEDQLAYDEAVNQLVRACVHYVDQRFKWTVEWHNYRFVFEAPTGFRSEISGSLRDVHRELVVCLPGWIAAARQRVTTPTAMIAKLEENLAASRDYCGYFLQTVGEEWP